jgi:hypothetical protein
VASAGAGGGRRGQADQDRSGDSPWASEDVTRLACILAAGLAANTIAWYGASGATHWSTQMRWLVLAIGGVTITAAGCVRWVIAGLRSTRHDRAEIVGAIEARWLAFDEPIRPVQDTRDVVVAGRTMTRFHRPTCQFAAGKQVAVLTMSQVRSRGLIPCPVCDS